MTRNRRSARQAGTRFEREADYLPLIVARLTKPIPMVLDLDGVGA